ncbi:MAG TPA: ABC transporter permease [Candidatus Dormibacteraeota bacterium]|nr:ABC transporter permease [Candidatus Dormibacteraeota bacterium]
MTLWARFCSWLGAALRRSRMESEMDAELRFHMEGYVEDLVRSGVPGHEALRRARLEFGGMERTKEECRETRGLNLVEGLIRDLRYSIRMLAKNPGFTAVAVLTLALAIGANTAIFSVVDAILLRPLPYPQASRLVFLSEYSEQVPGMSIAMANFNDWRSENHVFESMVAYQSDNVVLAGRGEAERVRLRRITAGFSPTLRVKPILGRTLMPEDDKVGAERVVLLGEGFWERRFGRDPSIIGQQLTIDSEPYTVIGVFPSRLHGSLRTTDLFTSLWRLENELGGEKNRGNHPGIYAYARLKPGVNLEQARGEMKGIAQHLDEMHPDSNGNQSITVQPLLEAIVEDVRAPLLVLIAAVGFVLLIACANLANLLLARATQRYRELAVRMALGASRGRLVRQMLTESVVLALAGGTLGLLLAVWISAAVVHGMPTGVPRLDEVSPDRWVLIFSLAISLATGIFFGIFPALQASRTNVQDALKESGRTGSPGSSRRRMRDALVAAEAAISLILLVGAGLMAQSLFRVLHADSGFNPSHVLTARFSLPDVRYKGDDKSRNFVEELVSRIQAIPGVEAAGVKNPLLGGWQTSYAIEGRPLPVRGQHATTDFSRVSPDAMRAMGMRLIRGRFFDSHDNAQTQRVCIIDETLVKQDFLHEDSLGKRIATDVHPGPGVQPAWMTVVGIVAHVKNYGVDQPSRVEMYVPIAQRPGGSGALLIRFTGDIGTFASSARSAVRSVDPDVPLFEMRPLEDIVNENTASRRLSVMLTSAFAILAVVLAGMGFYGVMAYLVNQRTQEIGIRLALGGTRGDILRLVVEKGLRLTATGIAIGLAGAAVLMHFISNLLYGVKATDPITFIAVTIFLSLVALAACYIPARRAARVDPMIALRYE